jgi:hypothetical protein
VRKVNVLCITSCVQARVDLKVVNLSTYICSTHNTKSNYLKQSYITLLQYKVTLHYYSSVKHGFLSNCTSFNDSFMTGWSKIKH